MIENVIVALYRTLLLREPSGTEIARWSRASANGTIDIEGLLRAFLVSDEFRQNISSFTAAYQAPTKQLLVNDHSQFGELSLLLRGIVNAAAAHRIVVDVGARGRERSNSYDLLHDFGWKGLLVEANRDLIPAIGSEFAGLDMTLVNVAASDYNGTACFAIGVNDDVSSLNAASAQNWGDIRGYVEVEVRLLGELLNEHAVPVDFDLLSLDIEGEDAKVLNHLIANTLYRPHWIIIELNSASDGAPLTSFGLSPAVAEAYTLHARTVANLILARRAPVPMRSQA